MAKSQETASVQMDSKDVKELQKKIKELETQLLAAEAEASSQPLTGIRFGW